MPYVNLPGFDKAQREYDAKTPFDDDPDDDAILDMQNEIMDERLDDINGYLLEAISEAPDSQLTELAGLCKVRNAASIGNLILRMQDKANWPSEKEAIEKMNEESDDNC